MGASTWQWLLDHDPEGWKPKPTWVFPHRDFPESEQVHYHGKRRAGARRDGRSRRRPGCRVIGDGDLAGQFHDVGLLDEVWVQYAPVALEAGAPVPPRHVELKLEEVSRSRDFLCGRYSVLR